MAQKKKQKKEKSEDLSKSDLFGDFALMEDQFKGDLPPAQDEVIGKIKKIIDVLDIGPDGKGFTEWPGEKLVSAREKISRYSEFLGDWISYHETRSDFAYIWRKGKMASDWQPIKTELAKGLKDKITNVEVENVLTEKYLQEQYYSMFHRRRADLLLTLMNTIDKMLRSIDSRLQEMERQRKLSYSSLNEEGQTNKKVIGIVRS
jgi:hypothetical protein